MSRHEMRYRAGTAGLAHLGIADCQPHWYCSCGMWRFEARALPHAASGNNKVAARRAFERHAAS